MLTRSPKQVFVGMIIAAHAVGSAHGIVYLRAEYAYLREYLEAQLAELRDDGWLGPAFDIRIQMGAGAYICGDESALIESCEGKRGTPRLKPPFPVENGFLGKPTCVNNVETFAAAARIMELGADWFAAMGTPESSGTRLLSVAGDCAAPGIYEVEWGITLREALELVGAEDARAVQISGPSGEMVSASADADRRLAFEDISCGGSFMVFNAQRDLLGVVRDFMQFFVDESCGICVPCRAGNVVLRQKVDLVLAGRADQSDLDDMVQWGGVIAKTSRCGLGTTSPNPILTTLVKFPEIYSDRIHQAGRLPAVVIRCRFRTGRLRQGHGATRRSGVEMTIQIEIDGVAVTTEEGRNLVDVAGESGVYVPTLCYLEGKPALGTCRACSVKVNGRVVPACTVKVTDGMRVEVDEPETTDMRKALVEILFSEGNHNCPSCEKSGRCTLQAVGYEVGMMVSRFPYQFPERVQDHASETIWLERDRCIFCQRCVEFVRDRATGKKIFSISGRGTNARIEIDVELANAMPPEQVEEAVAICPVGTIIEKRVGYDDPIGQRLYDVESIRDRVLEGHAE